MTKTYFAPGCALMIYKPDLASRIHTVLKGYIGKMDIITTCCHRDPGFNELSTVINICPGCDKRFRLNYNNCSTVSLWEILADSDYLPLPDYRHKKMTIIDACPTRDQERVHLAVRKLLKRMNIDIIEPQRTMKTATCCGDSFYGEIPTEKVKAQMIRKASELPLKDVAVYCVSCAKSMFTGGKKPHFLLDLLFSEKTLPLVYEPDAWHNELNKYIEAH